LAARVSAFLDRLRHGPCLLLDGGLGSELIARGLPPGAPPDLWTLERPGELAAVHRAYVTAGSEAIHANTFGANGARLARYGLQDRIADLNRTAVALARESGAGYVIADIGPTGEYLPPVGKGDPGRWREHFAQQAALLAETGVDALHIETMTDLREALLALESLHAAAPALPVLASLTFERKKRGFFTIMGDPLVASLMRLAAAGAVGVGANCSIVSPDMRDLAREVLTAAEVREAAEAPVSAAAPGAARVSGARGASSVCLVLQPNAGQPQATAGGVHYAQSPQEFAEDLASLLPDPRIAALGGCCGTDPRFIVALRARMAERTSPRPAPAP
jgi:methionine synthase I (cobalamin-dependent)